MFLQMDIHTDRHIFTWTYTYSHGGMPPNCDVSSPLQPNAEGAHDGRVQADVVGEDGQTLFFVALTVVLQHLKLWPRHERLWDTTARPYGTTNVERLWHNYKLNTLDRRRWLHASVYARLATVVAARTLDRRKVAACEHVCQACHSRGCRKAAGHPGCHRCARHVRTKLTQRGRKERRRGNADALSHD